MCHDYITILDFETTGLLEAMGTPLALQPFATELYAMQVDGEGNLVNEVNTLIKPPIPIPDFLVKAIGITNEMVANAPVFSEIYKEVVEVFLCSHTMVAHNLPFDQGILWCELARLGKEKNFPLPPIKFCTVEQSMHLKGYRLKNSELYELATGKEIEGAHRAKNDVLATYESYKWLKEQG